MYRIDKIDGGLRKSIPCQNKMEMIKLTTKLRKERIEEIIWYINNKPYKMYYRKKEGYGLVQFHDCIQRNKQLIAECEKTILFQNSLKI